MKASSHHYALGKVLSAFTIYMVMCFSVRAQNLTQTPVTDSVNTYIQGYYQCLPLDYDQNTNKKYPLLIFIHGIGELGNGTTDLYKVLRNGPPKLINQHLFPDSFVVGGKTFSFIVISPQLTANYRNVSVISTLIDYCVKKYRVDESRIYLTGLSMGGGISWIYAASTGGYASRIAALLDVCGNDAPTVTGVKNIATANLPVWATHNLNDPTVPSSNSIRWVDSLNAYAPAMNPQALLNIFDAATHDAWSQTYNLNWKPNGLNVFEWMLQYTRPSSQPANQLPTVNAGTNQTITLPKDSTTLTGTASDADGSITSYRWSKISGPSSFALSSPTTAQTKLSNLIQGTYTFRLTAIDNSGDSSSDNINITVNPAPNQPPVANAGNDKNITLPTDTVTLIGSGIDVDGSIVKYNWKKISGPAQFTINDTISSTPFISNLVAGTYTFQLTVTDNDGASATDNMSLIVNPAPNQAPVANAGTDKSITLPTDSIRLSGSGTDADGSITKYRWQKIAGPTSYTISDTSSAAPLVSNLVAGTYTFQLTVTDNNGASASDNMALVVNAAPNQSPVADAGTDKTITLPRDSITLVGSGTDADGNIVKYNWRKLSGPTQFSISDTSSATPLLSNLVSGTYTFLLTVTDNNGASASDNVNLIVNPAPNQSPVANAGLDKAITLPLDSLQLIGTASDPDGSIVKYNWKKLSGPTQYTISDTSSSTTLVSNLVAGTYTFQLTVTDNDGATATDNLNLVVNPAPNQAPVVNAGVDKALTLPLDSLQLIGTANDPDGSVTSIQWSQISGPAQVILSAPAQLQTMITGLIQGTYKFRLKATDNSGDSSTDDVQVKVNAATIIVSANAGIDTLIYKNQTRPDTAFLDGSASSNAASYAWSMISGPATPSFTSASAATTYAVGLKEGTYLFKLTVNGTYNDTVSVIVRDWQNKNVSPCRPGGGKSFIVPESSTGKYNQLYINRDNVLGEPVMGGDTLYFKGGTYSSFEIGDFGGNYGCPVYLMPKDSAVVITNGYFRIGVRDSNVVQHTIMDGTVLRGKKIPYGFMMDNSSLPIGNINYTNLVAGWVSNFTLKGYRSYNTGILQIKLDAKEYLFGRYDKFIEKHIVITDNFINYSTGEGMYIGNTAPEGGQLNNPYGPPPRMDSVEITNNVVMNTNWDGIQLSSARGGAIIRNNFVRNTGLLNQPSQRAGIILGSNTFGNVDSNMVVNSHGNGIQVFGFNNASVTGNVVDSIYSGNGDQDGFYQSFINNLPENNIPLSVRNQGNLLSRIERSYIKVANNSGNMNSGSDFNNYFIHPTETVANNLISDNANGTAYNNTIVKSFPFNVNSVGLTNIGVSISMTQADSTASFTNAKDIIDWLFRRLKTPVASNKPPVVDAGLDTTITLPLDTIRLAGSAIDSDGTIVRYRWSKLSGPSQFTFSDSTIAGPIAKGLVAGTYTFRLTVTDNGGATAMDSVRVKVNAAPNKGPVVYAGADTTITLPGDSLMLNGTANDPDGTISSVQWNKISGPDQFTIVSAAQSQTQVKDLVVGEYLFELKATDNKNVTARDTVQITVRPAPNKVPTVDAGLNRQITLPLDSVTLKGSASDSDGTIASYSWVKISGPASGTIQTAAQVQTKVTGLVQGTYYFRLTVTDNQGATASDSVRVIVKAQQTPANQVPVADAGPDKTITLPVNSVLLTGNGTDADGTVVKYSWSKVLGPLQYSISSPDSAKTNITGLKQGTYIFKLIVTDNSGDTASDDVKVIVNPPVNHPPVVNAGADKRITLPLDSVILNGSATDADGTIAGYTWTKIAGPSQFTITNANTAQTLIDNLVTGTYRFELKATDNNGASARDTVEVIVDPSVTRPILSLNIGEDRIITLPKDSVVLEAKLQNAFGTNITYHWTKISGPIQYTIDDPSSAKINVTGLTEGEYQFKCNATDGYNTVTDTVKVTVNSIPQSTAFVYPNPAVNNINVRIVANTHANETSLVVYNSSGNVVYKETFMRTDNIAIRQINISQLPAGVYFIEVSVDINNKVATKFIKRQ